MIADIECRAAQLMKDLGSAAGTQNIDRILGFPAPPIADKEEAARRSRAVSGKVIEFGMTVFEPKDFPDPVDPKAEEGQGEGAVVAIDSGQEEPSKRLIDLLLVRNKGAGVKYTVGGYEYESRSGLLFGFLRGCIQESISEDVIFDCCLGDLYAGSAIWEHRHDQAAAGIDPIDYLQWQLERTEEKTLQLAVDAESRDCRSCRGWSTSSSARKPQGISAFGSRGSTGWSKALASANGPKMTTTRSRRSTKRMRRARRQQSRRDEIR